MTMILVETEVTTFSERSGSLLVSHTAARLPRGLEPGEVVVVRSGDRHWTGCVVDLDFTLEDTLYRLELGARLPAARAERLLGGDAAEAGDQPRVEVDDVLGLLGALRAVGGVTVERRAAHRLLAEG